MRAVLAACFALGVIVVGGVCHGVLSDRWGRSEALSTAAARLANVPTEIGGWRSRDLEINPAAAEQAELAGHVFRSYENPATGAEVTVLLVCGRPGPISAHSPLVCFPGAGFVQTSPPVTSRIDSSAGEEWEFARSGFTKETPVGQTHVRIFWSLSADGNWSVPRNPRLHFATNKYLYKVYVTRELNHADEAIKDDPALDFLAGFLPEINRVLFAPGE